MDLAALRYFNPVTDFHAGEHFRELSWGKQALTVLATAGAILCGLPFLGVGAIFTGMAAFRAMTDRFCVHHLDPLPENIAKESRVGRDKLGLSLDDSGERTVMSEEVRNKVEEDVKQETSVLPPKEKEEVDDESAEMRDKRSDESNVGPSGQSPLEQINKDVLMAHIVPELKAKDLAALSESSKTMKRRVDPVLASTWNKIKTEITIGPDQWKSVGFDVKDVPKLPDDIDVILKSDCPYFKGKKVFETHKLILMPGGLSINQQGILMRDLRDGDHENVFRNFYGLSEKQAAEEITKPYWALVSTEVIPGSRNCSFAYQKALLKDGYVIPTVIDVIALATMDKKCSEGKKEYLLPKGPVYTLTRCTDGSVNGYQMVVGAFASSGLLVYYFNYDSVNIGVLALRKFC